MRHLACLLFGLCLAANVLAVEKPQRVGRWNLSSPAVKARPAPNQQEVAVALQSGEVQLWRLSADAPRLQLAAKDVLDLAWSPDSESIAWAQRDGSVTVVERRSGKRQVLLPAGETPTSSVLFLLDRVTLACAQGNQLKLIDLASGEIFREARLAEKIRRLEWDNDGGRIVALTSPPGFAWFDLAHQVWDENTPTCAANHVAYRHFGSGLRMDCLLPGKRAKVYLVGLGNPPEEHYPEENLGDEKSLLATAVHGDLVAVIDRDNVRLLETDEYEVSYQFSTGMPRVLQAEFNPSGTLLALAGTNELQVWKIPTLPLLPAKVMGEDGLRFVQKSNTVVCLGDSITAWDWQSRACLAALPRMTLPDGGFSGNKTAISASGTRLAVSDGEHLDLWNLETLLPLARLNLDGTVVPLELRRGRFPKPQKKDPLKPALVALQSPSSLAISPDDKTLAIARSNGSLQTWQIEPLQKIADWLPPARVFRQRQELLQLHFSPDGSKLAGTYARGIGEFGLAIFASDQRQKIADFPGYLEGSFWFCWTPDSAGLLTTIQRTDRKQCVVRVNATTGREAEDLLSHNHVRCGRVFGSLLATNNWDYLGVYDLQTGKSVIGDPEQYGTSLTSGFALAPDGESLAAGGYHGVVFVKVPREAAARAPRALELAWKPQSSPANSVAWLDKERFVTAQENGEVHWWSLSQQKEQATLKTRAHSLSCVTITPNGDCIVVGGSRNDRGWLEVLDVEKRQMVIEHSIEHSCLVKLVTGPDGAIAWGTDQGQLALYDLSQRKTRWSQQVANQEVFEIAFNPNGKSLAVGGQTESKFPAVVLRAAATGEVTEIITLPRKAQLQGLAWSPDGQKLAIGSSAGLKLFDTASKSSSQPAKSEAMDIRAVAWLSDDEMIFATNDKKLQRLQLSSGALQLVASHRHDFESLTVSPGRKQVLTLDGDGGIQLRGFSNISQPAPVRPAGPVDR